MYYDDDESDCETLSGVWGVRILAGLCFIFGTSGVDGALLEDLDACPRFSQLALFWAAMRSWAALFICCDLCLCAFFLRLSWISFHIHRVARVYTAVLTLIAVFGLGNYGLLIKEHECWDPKHILAILMLILYLVAWCLWSVAIDCVDRCCGEDDDDEFTPGKCCCSCPCCCCSLTDFFSLEPWRADQDSDEENPSLVSVSDRERGKHSASNSSSQKVGGKKLLFPPMPKAAGGPSPTTLGRGSKGGSGKNSTRSKEIRVFRGSDLIHVGRARGAVRRWLRRNVQDTRDVVVQDLSGPSLREAMAAAHRAKASGDDERKSPGSKGSRPQQVPPLDLSRVSFPS